MQLILFKLQQFTKANYDTLLFISLAVTTFCLSVNFSKDWVNYVWMYDRGIAKTSWHVFFTDFSVFKEPLYFFASKTVGSLIGFPFFVFSATLILLTIKLNCISKILGNPYLGTFFYTCFYLLLLEGTAIRLAYAVTLVFVSLYYIKIHKFKFAFLLILLASQVHLSALLFMLVFPLYFIKSICFFVYLMFVLSPLLIIFDISILSLLREYVAIINPKYLWYLSENKLLNQNSTGLFFYFIAFYMSILVAIYFFMKEMIERERFLATVFSISLFGVILMCVFHDRVSVGARLGELLLVPTVILLSRLYMVFSVNKMVVYQTGLIGLSIMYFASRFLYLYPKAVGL